MQTCKEALAERREILKKNQEIRDSYDDKISSWNKWSNQHETWSQCYNNLNCQYEYSPYATHLTNMRNERKDSAHTMVSKDPGPACSDVGEIWIPENSGIKTTIGSQWFVCKKDPKYFKQWIQDWMRHDGNNEPKSAVSGKKITYDWNVNNRPADPVYFVPPDIACCQDQSFTNINSDSIIFNNNTQSCSVIPSTNSNVNKPITNPTSNNTNSVSSTSKKTNSNDIIIIVIVVIVIIVCISSSLGAALMMNS